jgi:fumarate reductase flavoprotein subunit
MANMLARLADPLDCFALFDDKIWQGPGKNARIPANPNIIKGGATVYRADSLHALASQIGVAPERLGQTVQDYNAAHRAGSLPQLTPPRSNAVVPACAIEQPPFYAIPLCAGITYTMGGIVTDSDGRVLKPDGSAVSGLYAAGVTAGGLEGGRIAGYVGGLIQAAVFGLRSAEHAAKIVSSRR